MSHVPLSDEELEGLRLEGRDAQGLRRSYQALRAEFRALPKFVKYKRDPTQMTSIAVSWPVETYGSISLFETPHMVGASRGWAEPSDLPGVKLVILRANGEASWMSQEDARNLAAMLIAASNGASLFDPKKSGS